MSKQERPEPVDLIEALESLESYADEAVADLRDLDSIIETGKALLVRTQDSFSKRRKRIADIMADIKEVIDVIQESVVVTPTEKPLDDDDTLDLPKVPQL